MLRLICIVASVSIAAADFVPADEACGNDEEDCALSLRQLRGHQAEVEVSEHRAAPLAESPQVNELAEPIEVTPDTAPEEAEEDEYDEDLEEEIKINETARQNKREAEEGGTCCFSGENSKDTCGTCYPMSIASYKSKCSKNNCMGCGGTWCQSTCVIGAADPLRKCQTAYPTGVSKDPVCSRDPIACHGCQGEWCRAGYNSHFVIEENSHGREVPEYMAPEDTDGICCYRGEQKVKAFKDPEDPCKSAEPMTGIAERWDFCALNEKHCTSCKGAWCLPGNITYYDGTKYKPGVEYEPISDQRLTAENHTATQEAEEEVANDDSLDDLFPDGLADTAHDLPKDAEEPEGAEGAEDEDEPPPFA